MKLGKRFVFGLGLVALLSSCDLSMHLSSQTTSSPAASSSSKQAEISSNPTPSSSQEPSSSTVESSSVSTQSEAPASSPVSSQPVSSVSSSSKTSKSTTSSFSSSKQESTSQTILSSEAYSSVTSHSSEESISSSEPASSSEIISSESIASSEISSEVSSQSEPISSEIPSSSAVSSSSSSSSSESSSSRFEPEGPLPELAPAKTTASSPKTKNITLKDTSEAEIRTYYGHLMDIDDERERVGLYLLEHLKPILASNHEFFNYASIWNVYEITDRDWSLSPATNDKYATFDVDTQTYSSYTYGSNSSPKNDPYAHVLYRNPGVESGYIKVWGSHTQSGGTNREHVWPNSIGFGDEFNSTKGPAYNDLHHLIIADGYVNNIHGNTAYGNVKTPSTDCGKKFAYTAGNYLGTSTAKKSYTVFEPQDCDKGDIARACFYMMARYNNLSGTDTITSTEPNLALWDEAYNAGSKNGAETASSPAKLGFLSDLLEWHHLDPVDDYEIHRNNLIYENYQHNRNPFIDFPEWVDAIWGSQGHPADPYADPVSLIV